METIGYGECGDTQLKANGRNYNKLINMRVTKGCYLGCCSIIVVVVAVVIRKGVAEVGAGVHRSRRRSRRSSLRHHGPTSSEYWGLHIAAYLLSGHLQSHADFRPLFNTDAMMTTMMMRKDYNRNYQHQSHHGHSGAQNIMTTTPAPPHIGSPGRLAFDPF